MAPLAIGSILMVMVYSGGHISGGHFNPTVTLGVWIRDKLAVSDLPGCWIAQFSGGILAAVLFKFAINYAGLKTNCLILIFKAATISVVKGLIQLKKAYTKYSPTPTPRTPL